MNKKNKTFRFWTVLLSVLLCLGFVLPACSKPEKEVTGIEVTKQPTKTVYEVGETLDFTGGEITVTYSDSSTEKVSLTSPDVTTTKPNMATTGEKTISVTYKSVNTMFKITVTSARLNVTFDLNFVGAPAAEVVKVENGGKVSAPSSEPSRSGYRFLGWYVAADSESKFNFDTVISADTTIYARWAVAYTVKFNYNYTGAPAAQEVIVGEGEKVNKPADPTGNTGNVFGGWFTTAECNQVYDFNTIVTANTELYAGWIAESATACTVTIHYNYPDGTDRTLVVKVAQNTTLVAPKAPTFEGSTFNSWCTDAEGENAYTFGAVTEDTEIYAKWNISEYVIKYYYNHANNSGIAQTFKADATGNPKRFLQVVGSTQPRPELNGYYLYGWYTEPECVNQFTDLSTRIEKSWNLYARWVKENTFEAEYTNLDEKDAFGYSDNGKGPLVLVKHNAQEGFVSSNGHWVASLHYQNSFLDFEITSDRAVTDAVLVLRLSADFFDITLTPTNYEISVNGVALNYSAIELTGAVSGDKGGLTTKRPFTNHEITVNLNLKEGKNVIKLKSLDSVKYGEVGTINATAPMIDCIYVNTDATLTWNPKLGNVAD